MTAVVLSVTAVVLLMTGLASMVSVDALQEMLADFSWAPLAELPGDLLHDMFTDAHGAPIF